MTDKRSRTLRFIYGAITGCACIVTGFLLIAGCVGIYRSGDRPYSREAVATAFQGISILVYITLALIVFGFLLSLFLPNTRKKGQLPPAHMTLRRLHRKLDITRSGPSLRKDISALQRKRRLHCGITVGLLVIGSTLFLVYACDGAHFHPLDVNSSVSKATLLMLACLGIPAIYGFFAKWAAKRSMDEEIRLMLKFAAKRTEQLPEVHTSNAIWITRLLLLTAAVGILLYGLVSGGTLDVLTKAVNICTECIGLG